MPPHFHGFTDPTVGHSDDFLSTFSPRSCRGAVDASRVRFATDGRFAVRNVGWCDCIWNIGLMMGLLEIVIVFRI